MDVAVSSSFGKAQQLSGISLSTFIASISTSVAVFGVELLLFILVRYKFPHL